MGIDEGDDLSRFISRLRARRVRILQDRSGASAVEYALLLSFIAAVIVASVTALGAQLAGALSSFVASW